MAKYRVRNREFDGMEDEGYVITTQTAVNALGKAVGTFTTNWFDTREEGGGDMAELLPPYGEASQHLGVTFVFRAENEKDSTDVAETVIHFERLTRGPGAMEQAVKLGRA